MIIKSPSRPARNKSAATLALDWVKADMHGASILATAQNLLDAEQEARRALPPGIAHVCRVARIDKQRMTLAVPSAAHASKLRQLVPRILAQLNHAGWNLNEITVRVQGALVQSPPPPFQKTAEPLGPVALDAFSQLHDAIAPGPLADAVQRLLKHHQG